MQHGRLFRFDEQQKKHVDVTAQHPDVHRRLQERERTWKESVKSDQSAYRLTRPRPPAASK